MVSDRYRLTEWRTPDQGLVGTELYDLDHDPKNNVNLASVKEHEALVQQLSDRLR
jgi:hypothetical protein